MSETCKVTPSIYPNCSNKALSVITQQTLVVISNSSVIFFSAAASETAVCEPSICIVSKITDFKSQSLVKKWQLTVMNPIVTLDVHKSVVSEQYFKLLNSSFNFALQMNRDWEDDLS